MIKQNKNIGINKNSVLKRQLGKDVWDMKTIQFSSTNIECFLFIDYRDKSVRERYIYMSL